MRGKKIGGRRGERREERGKKIGDRVIQRERDWAEGDAEQA